MTANIELAMKTKLEKTLIMNRQMQSQLFIMREKLERLLSNVKDTYEANDVLLKEGILKPQRKGVGIKGAYLKGGTFYLKGNMFFKDIKCRNCPNNQDYEKRKMGNEMFPMDLNLKSRHVWSTLDKQGIILGIKEQIIDYLAQSSKRQGRKKSKEVDSEKLGKLLSMVSDDFLIDWDNISSHNLQHRHSAKTCEAIWNLFLHPSLKRSAWSEKENNKLFEAAKKHNFQNWQAIAEDVGKRSDFQCFVQYQSNVCHMLPESYTKWTKEDDKRLLDVIARNTVNGIVNWSNVNAYFPHKAKTTLHFRYNFTLNPDIRRAQFTPEEDLLLIAAVKEYGKKFSCIPRSLFPNRSLIQLRSHYNNVLSKRHKSHPWTLEDDIKLMDYVTDKGTKSWLACEQFLNERHSRLSCRTRFLTIKRHLEKNPTSSIENLPRKNMKTGCINIQNWKEKADELSLNSNVEKHETKPKKCKRSGKKKFKNDKKNVSKKSVKKMELIEENIQQTDEKVRPLDENKYQIEEIVSEPIQTIAKKIKPKKPYITRLRENGRNNYNFFKYAYDFDINRHPFDNIQIIDDDFRIVLSALSPRIQLTENFEFASVTQHEQQNIIIKNPVQLPTCQTLKLLPPNWSTAMGFRALCINTACASTNLTYEHFPKNTNNDHIRRFRERLRLIFYSTALLSRLDPGMVGITTIETEPTVQKPLKRKLCVYVNDVKEHANKNDKRIKFIEDIKTELET